MRERETEREREREGGVAEQEERERRNVPSDREEEGLPVERYGRVIPTGAHCCLQVIIVAAIVAQTFA